VQAGKVARLHLRPDPVDHGLAQEFVGEREPPVVKDDQHAPDRRSGDRLDVDPVEAAFLGAEQSGEVRVGQKAGHREQPEQVPCVVVAEQ